MFSLSNSIKLSAAMESIQDPVYFISLYTVNYEKSIIAAALIVILGMDSMTQEKNFRTFNYFLPEFSGLEGIKTENLNFIKQPEGILISSDTAKNSYVSFNLRSPIPFNELICSVTGDGNGEIETFVQVNGEEFSCGAFSPAKGESKSRKTTAGSMDTDILRLSSKSTEIKVRIELRPLSNKKAVIKLANFAFSDSTLPFIPGKKNKASFEKIKLDLKGISQMARQISYKGDICSPTSLSAVMAYYGIKEPPESVAEAVVDNSDGIYGNWLFNTAYASTRGLYSFVARLNSLDEAALYIKKGIPVIASLTFGPDELKGSPLKKTRGHLLVIKGFDERGNVITMDPAACEDSRTEIVYDRKEFEEAWLKNKFGTCYILIKDIYSLSAAPFPFAELFSDTELKNIETQILPGESLKVLPSSKGSVAQALNQKTLKGKKLVPYEGYLDKTSFALAEKPDYVVINKTVFIYGPDLKKKSEKISIGSRVEKLISIKDGLILARASGRPLILSSSDLLPIEANLKEKEAREKVLSSARQFISDAYYWGGKSSSGVDCSGLAYLSYLSAGLEIPRNASDQLFSAYKKDYRDLKPGDLVFSSGENSREINHVMIYSGKGMIIEATMDCGCVREISLKEKFGYDFSQTFKNGSKAGKKIIYFGAFLKSQKEKK